MELPLKRDDRVDVFHLHIHRDGGDGKQTASSQWSVWLRFDLAPLGPLCAKLSLSGTTVSAQLWAERRATTDLVQRHLPMLADHLSQAGLDVGTLHCRQGNPPSAPAPGEHSLVDIRA